MNNPRTLKVVIAVLTIALLTSLGFLGRALVRNYWWEREAYGLAGMVASMQAREDFREGRLRLLVLDGENDHLRYSGSNDGPFEIWIPHFYPSLGYAHRFSTEQQVEFYNRKMRYMHEHPEKFVAQPPPKQSSAHVPDSSGIEDWRWPASGVCPVHNAAMRTEVVYGLHGFLDPTKEYGEARRQLFPHAGIDYGRDMYSKRRGRIYICAACVQARAEWSAEWKKNHP